MKLVMKAAASVLALSCCLSAAGATSANAMTLMDFIRGGQGRQQSTQVSAPVTANPAQTGIGATAPTQAKEPLPSVSAPKYYTYKPEAMRLVASNRFADPVVTGAVADASSTPVAVDTSASQRRYLTEARVMATNDVAKALEAYYADQSKPLLWVADNVINDKAKAAMAVLADAGSVGLDPADYAVQAPSFDPASVDPTMRDRALMQFELALSGKVLMFVQDTIRGRLDPNKISGYHDFKRKDVNLTPVLGLLRASPDVAAYLNSRSPSNQEFTELKAELAKLHAESGNDSTHISISLNGTLKPGGSSPEMANIVKAIQHRGSDALKVKNAVTLAAYKGTPDYTPELVSLVEDFQKEKGLTADGVIGQSSVRAMVGENNDTKVQKLVIAMEQLRWLPSELGPRYVFINQPAFMVYYHNNNHEQLSMRVVVGGKEHQTFFFEDQVQTVEFNPFWGVPQSIIINEMLPKLRADPNYLDRMGYQVEVGGHAVASSSVDWYGSTQNVSVRQPPSSDNALGELKILFPNSHAIYMHDTPQKSFFKKDMRALSHGCVRLADPRAMAAAVLNTTVDDIAKQIATGQNKAVPVPQKFPIYIAYFTAWPNKDGVVQYFNDVYDRDAATQKALDATTKARTAQI
ncbi:MULTISPECIES: L,D-transpeptidase family protein [unclassified Rhizobium]|uniref:L,D-transpeptidase family protein n=1 Tax=unclassified Rhizobium TaxID=2613769 RepID=UPI000CDF4411|nr:MULTISPECIES: L,D-transpeptidase family protein [Rhizobium]AVA21809.1 L,D-transpeptidase domain-containing protein [Rhizobium sp. NXC24]MDK4737735.1 L,D-transpeptidase family protein [Rhizobium sp. CNPSo 3464]UWU22862.1 L,D-transpeptidase family protein [Rhizobium tropici]